MISTRFEYEHAFLPEGRSTVVGEELSYLSIADLLGKVMGIDV